MKRHMDLIQKLLEHIEQSENEVVQLPPDFPNYSSDQVRYHIQLCHQAGLILHHLPEHQHMMPNLFSLTWLGHEELDQIRTTPSI